MPVAIVYERKVQDSSSPGGSSSSSDGYEPEVIVRVSARATCAALRLQIKDKDMQVSIHQRSLFFSYYDSLFF